MVTAYSSFVRCSWQRWWNRIVLCRPLLSWNIPGIPWSVAPPFSVSIFQLVGHQGLQGMVSHGGSHLSEVWSVQTGTTGGKSYINFLRSGSPMLGWTSLQPCPTQLPHTSFRKTCNPQTWASILHPWCRGWQGPSPRHWVTSGISPQAPQRIGHIQTWLEGKKFHLRMGWVHMDHGVDRPTSLPLSHRISLMDDAHGGSTWFQNQTPQRWRW